MKFLRGSCILYVLIACGVFVPSCKDMGDVPPTPPLTATPSSVSLTPGAQRVVTISGGNPPYAISQQPAAAVASATLVNNLLTIEASPQNVSGTTSVKVTDMDSHGRPNDSPSHEGNEIEIIIQLSAASVISFSAEVQPIFTNRCVNAGCHPGGSAPFPLQAGVSYGRLVNVTATEAPCAGILRVAPRDAANSALYRRLEGTCGEQMPRGLAPLPLSERELIRDWIIQGAANN